MTAVAAVAYEVLGSWNQLAQVRCLLVVLMLAGAASLGLLGATSRPDVRS